MLERLLSVGYGLGRGRAARAIGSPRVRYAAMGIVFLVSLSAGPVAARDQSNAPVEPTYRVRQGTVTEAAGDRVMFGSRFGGQTP